MIPSWYRVLRMRRETFDTFTFELEPEDGSTRPTFLPGQFNMLYAFGVGEVPISISGDAANEDELVHTIRAVGPVTQAMRSLRRGERIGVRGPFGSAWPVDLARKRDVVIVAGGIGLAPLRPSIYHLLNNRDDFEHISLLYGARKADDMLFRDEIREWRSRLDFDVDVTVDRCVGRWRGNVGVVTNLIPRASFDPANTTAMICGPEIMIRYTVQTLRQQGVSPEDIFVSMERNMKCGIGLCGHCQLGPSFICKDGPVYRFDRVEHLFNAREL